MDPFSITATSASVASLCVKTIYTLAKWGHEVKGIDTSLSGLKDEIESVQSVVASLDIAMKGAKLDTVATFSSMLNAQRVWDQIGRSIKDAEGVLQALYTIIEKFDKSGSGVFAKVSKQFRMSLESGEITTLRQRLGLINSALNLPLQMLGLMMQFAKAEQDDKFAQVLAAKVTDMGLSISAIRDALPRQARTPNVVDENDLYGHVEALAESVGEFASGATVVLGNASSTGTVKDFPTVRYSGPEPAGHRNIPAYNTAAESVYGSPQPEEKHLQILSWITPGTPNGSRGRAHDEDNIVVSDDIHDLSSAVDDLEVELHGKRLAKGMKLLEDNKFDEASSFFAKALKRLEKQAAVPGVQTLINEVRLPLAQSLAGQKRDDEASAELTNLVEATGASPDDPILFSAKHALAELALRRGDAKQAENLCLEALRGRRSLANRMNNSACYASMRLLVDIYKALDDPDEVEVWLELLPTSELPRHERFIRCDKEVRRLSSGSQTDAAVDMAIRFLKDNYDFQPFWHWSEEDLQAKWSEVAENIRLGQGFLGWKAGMCTLHLLGMVGSVSATLEVEYLLRQGATVDATFCLPEGPRRLKLDDRTCLIIAALHDRAEIADVLLRHGAGNHLAASCLAAAGGHLRLMQRLAAHGLGPGEHVQYRWGYLSHALLFDRTNIAEWLIQQGPTGSYIEETGETMMDTAASGNSVGCLEMLLKRGEQVSSRDEYGREPIHQGAYYGSSDAVSWLLDNGADIEAETHNHRKARPLHCAASSGEAASGKLLITRGANVKALKQGKVSIESVLDTAIRHGRVSFVKMLINAVPAQFESWMLQPSTSLSPVHLAVSWGQVDVVRVLLDSAPPSFQIDTPSLVEGEYITSLYSAVLKNDVDCAKILVEHGASVLAEYRGQNTIHWASGNGNIDILRVLVSALPTGHTVDMPFLDARKYWHTPLTLAVHIDAPDCVRYLLDEGAAVLWRGGPDGESNGDTPLHIAARLGYAETLRVLVTAISLITTAGAIDVWVGEHDVTPLMLAAERPEVDCVEVLLANGAEKQLRDTLGQTAAHYAAFKGSNDVLQLLLSDGTPWYYHDHPEEKENQYTMIERAVMGGQLPTIKLLLGLGVPMFSKELVKRWGAAIYWKRLGELIESGEKDPVAMARFLSEQYAIHYPKWWKDSKGYCGKPMGLAIEKGNITLVEILLDAGFDSNSALHNGKRPLEAAVESGNDEMVQLLRHHGASNSRAEPSFFKRYF